jgi:hypothetical protein
MGERLEGVEVSNDSFVGEGGRESGMVSRVLDCRLKTCGTSRGRKIGWFASIYASTINAILELVSSRFRYNPCLVSAES